MNLAESWKAVASENRRTLNLAMPIAAGHVGQMLMGWADAAMVGHTGSVALAACSFANTLLMVPMVVGFGILSSVSVRASLGHGAGDAEAAWRTHRAGTLTAIALGLGTAALAWASLPLLGFLGQKPEVVAAAPGYLVLCAISTLPAFVSTSAKGFAEALSSPWPPFWILMAAVALNVVLNWIFIFGNLGAPALGLEGAGWATLLARTAAAVAMLLYPEVSRRLRHGRSCGQHPGSLAREIQALLALGFPVGAMHLGEISGFAAGSLMMGWISVEALAAHQIAITCAATSFMVPLGLSQAVCVRVGQARGSGNPARCLPIVLGGLGMAVVAMTAFAAAFLLGGRPLASAFTTDQILIDVASRLLVVAGFFQVLDGIQIVSSGALRGFEDVRVPMWIGMAAYWLVALPVCYMAAFPFGLGAVGVWLGFSAGLLVAAACLLWRLVRRLGACTPDGNTGIVSR